MSSIMLMSVADYLSQERDSQSKHEWIEGELREMVGASTNHNLLCWNIAGILHRLLAGTDFVAFPSDMKVRIPDRAYYYPDVTIAPFPPRLEDDSQDTLLNPLVVFEVLSPSTEAIDRGEKLRNYSGISSLTDYLLVSQDEVRIDHYHRESENGWNLRMLTSLEDTVTLAEPSCELSLSEVYTRIDFRNHP